MNSNRGIVATYTNELGEERIIHATPTGFRLKRQRLTPALALNQTVGRMIGRTIRIQREKAGLSLAGLCQKAGIVSATPKQRMYEIEMGKRPEGLRLGTLYAIAEALDIEPAHLLPLRSAVLTEAGIKSIKTPTLSMET